MIVIVVLRGKRIRRKNQAENHIIKERILQVESGRNHLVICVDRNRNF